jgi:hypothetical protein
MKYFKTAHEKKSAIITTLITTLLILLFFLLGLKYYDPPISFGMEVNFGNLDQGMGKDIPKKELVSNNKTISELQKETTNQIKNSYSKKLLNLLNKLIKKNVII